MLKAKHKIILSPLWLIGHMPIWVLHGISYFFYTLMYYVARYRRSVVLENLKNSFPEKTKKEIEKITKRFYLHLCDTFIEGLYLMRMSPEESVKRYEFQNTEVYEELYAKGKEIICVTGHFANWEWSCVGWYQMPHRTIGVYKPLQNKLMDDFFIYNRTRMGSQVVALRDTFKLALSSKRNNDKFGILLVGDQRPVPAEIKLWINFLNQETPVIVGPEKMAQKLDAAVVFFDVQPVRRGYYKIFPHLITDNAKNSKEFEITKKFFTLLEKQIRNRPEYYLWSHKRWKYSKKDVDTMMGDIRLKKA